MEGSLVHCSYSLIVIGGLGDKEIRGQSVANYWITVSVVDIQLLSKCAITVATGLLSRCTVSRLNNK